MVLLKKDSMIRWATEGKWRELFEKFDSKDIDPQDPRVLINQKSPKYFGSVLWHAVQLAIADSEYVWVLQKCLALGADPVQHPDVVRHVLDVLEPMHLIPRLLFEHGARFPEDLWVERLRTARTPDDFLPLVYFGEAETQVWASSRPELAYMCRVWSPARRLAVAAVCGNP